MRRGFYCDQPEPDGLPPELGDLDALRGRQTADRVLRLLRDTAATRRVRVGVAVVGSIGAIAIASPVSSLLHTSADADPDTDAAGPPSTPPTSTTPPPPAPPTALPPAAPRPAHEPPPAHEAQAEPAAATAPPSPERVHQVRTLVTAAEQAVASLAHSATDAEHAVSTALQATGPDQVLAGLDNAAASVRQTKTAADTVTQQAHDAAAHAAQLGDPALASRARTAHDTATNLAQRATATLDTHAHSVGQARYATLVAATQRAVSQAEPPVAAAEAVAARADRATTAARQALDAGNPSAVVAPLLSEAVAAVAAAAAPVAGGAAAGKAATDSAQHIREQPQRDAARALSTRANSAATSVKQLRTELPNLQHQLTTLRHAEKVADATTTKAAAARDAVATVQKALDDATAVHVTGVSQRDARDFAAAERSAADANTKLTLAAKAQTDADKTLTAADAILTPDLVNADPDLRPAADTLRAAQHANTTNTDRIRVLGQHITTLTEQAKTGRQAADRDAAFRDQAHKLPVLLAAPTRRQFVN